MKRMKALGREIVLGDTAEGIKEALLCGPNEIEELRASVVAECTASKVKWATLLAINDSSLASLADVFEAEDDGESNDRAEEWYASDLVECFVAGDSSTFGHSVRALAFMTVSGLSRSRRFAECILRAACCPIDAFLGDDGCDGQVSVRVSAAVAALRCASSLFPKSSSSSSSSQKQGSQQRMVSFASLFVSWLLKSPAAQESGIDALISLTDPSSGIPSPAMESAVGAAVELSGAHEMVAAVASVLVSSRSDSVSWRALAHIVKFVASTDDSPAKDELLQVITAMTTSADSDTAIAAPLLLARLLLVGQPSAKRSLQQQLGMYSDWFLSCFGGQATTATDALTRHAIEALSNSLPFEQEYWIRAHSAILPRIGRLLPLVNDYTSNARQRIDVFDRERESASSCDSLSQVRSQQRQVDGVIAQSDPEAFARAEVAEFKTSRKISKSLKAASFFRQSWFIAKVVPAIGALCGPDTTMLSAIKAAGLVPPGYSFKRTTSGNSQTFLGDKELSSSVAGFLSELSSEAASRKSIESALERVASAVASSAKDTADCSNCAAMLFGKLAEALKVARRDFLKPPACQQWTGCFCNRVLFEQPAVKAAALSAIRKALETGVATQNEVAAAAIATVYSIAADGFGFLDGTLAAMPLESIAHVALQLRFATSVVEAALGFGKQVVLVRRGRRDSGSSNPDVAMLPATLFHAIAILRDVASFDRSCDLLVETATMTMTHPIVEGLVSSAGRPSVRWWVEEELRIGKEVIPEEHLQEQTTNSLWRMTLPLGERDRRELFASVLGECVSHTRSHGSPPSTVLCALGNAAACLCTEDSTSRPWVYEALRCRTKGRGVCCACDGATVDAFWRCTCGLPSFLCLTSSSFSVPSAISLRAALDTVDSHMPLLHNSSTKAAVNRLLARGAMCIGTREKATEIADILKELHAKQN